MTAAIKVSLRSFVGTWRVSRTILDHGAGPDGRFVGTAIFSDAQDGLIYNETGELTLDGLAPFKAERRYLWRSTESVIAVSFADGRPFHSFDPDMPEATHWCDPDTYHVTYDFSAWPVWTSIWDVQGPKKAYQMVTSYER